MVAVLRSSEARSIASFTGVKCFSATMQQPRDQLGERVTEWKRAHPELEVIDVVVSQSSDHAFHCLTISVFYRSTAAVQ